MIRSSILEGLGTVLENSKSKVLTWVRAIFLVMDSKRGISAKELQGKLNISYQTAWSLLKIDTRLSSTKQCRFLKPPEI